MPEAAVDENGHPLPSPGEIGLAWKREVSPPASQTKKPKGGGEAELGGSVTLSPNCRHVASTA